MISDVRKAKFKNSIDKYLNRSYERSSIGLLQEKTLHSIVKDLYANGEDNKEVKLEGFVADILNEAKSNGYWQIWFLFSCDKMALPVPGPAPDRTCRDEVGIVNTGNSCYMAVILQAFFHLSGLAEKFFKLPMF